MTNEEIDGLVDEKIFEIDRTANTPERRRMAIYSAIPVGVGYPLDDGSIPFCFGGVRYDAKCDGRVEVNCEGENWVWWQRRGKPWEVDLEKYIAGWRVPPSMQWSTDAAAALELLEVLKDRKLYPGLCSGVDGWWCVLGGGTKTVQDHAATLQMAICLAALRYVELNRD